MANNIPRRIKKLNDANFYCIIDQIYNYISDKSGKDLMKFLLYEFRDENEIVRFLETAKTNKKIKSYIGLPSDFVNYIVLDQYQNTEKVVEKQKEIKKVQSSKTENKNQKEYCVVLNCTADDIILLNVERSFDLYEFDDKEEKEKFLETGKTKSKKEKKTGLISNLSNYTVVRKDESGRIEKIKEENLVTIEENSYDYGIVHIYPSMNRYLIFSNASSNTSVVSDALFDYKDYKESNLFKISSEEEFIDYEKNVEKMSVVKLSSQMITFDLIKNLREGKEEHLFFNVFNEPRLLCEDDEEYFNYNESLYKNNVSAIKKSLEANETTNPKQALKQLKDVLNSIGILKEDGSIKDVYAKAFESDMNKKMIKTKETNNK